MKYSGATVRQFSSRSVPREVIEDCLCVARNAPSGANKQPWHFVVVSDAELKRKIRVAAEEERRFYHGRAPKEWLDALAPLGTDENKPYLEIAPYLIVIFAQHYEVTNHGRKVKNYYPIRSPPEQTLFPACTVATVIRASPWSKLDHKVGCFAATMYLVPRWTRHWSAR